MRHSPTRLGLIGAGRWGQNVIRAARGLDGIDLIAVASRNPETPSLLNPGQTLFRSYDALFGIEDLEGIIIATPPPTHADIARRALTAGKSIFVEKPLTDDLLTAKELLDLATARSLVGVVDHIHLYANAFQDLIRRLDTIGPVRSINAKAGNKGPVRDDIGVLWDWGPHDVAMALQVVGSEPIETACRRKALADGAEEIDLRLMFPDGITSTFHFSNGARKRIREFRVVGAGGTLTYVDAGAERSCWHAKPGDQSLGDAVMRETSPPLDLALSDFASAIRTGTPVSSDLAFGARVVSVLCDAEARATDVD